MPEKSLQWDEAVAYSHSRHQWKEIDVLQAFDHEVSTPVVFGGLHIILGTSPIRSFHAQPSIQNTETCSQI